MENDQLRHQLSASENENTHLQQRIDEHRQDIIEMKNENKHMKQRFEEQRRDVLELSKAKDEALTRYSNPMSVLYAVLFIVQILVNQRDCT